MKYLTFICAALIGLACPCRRRRLGSLRWIRRWISGEWGFTPRAYAQRWLETFGADLFGGSVFKRPARLALRRAARAPSRTACGVPTCCDLCRGTAPRAMWPVGDPHGTVLGSWPMGHPAHRLRSPPNLARGSLGHPLQAGVDRRHRVWNSAPTSGTSSRWIHQPLAQA